MNKTKIFLIVISVYIFVLSGSLFAQNGSIQGTVKNGASGDSIPYVAVFTPIRGTASDLGGNYTIPNLPQGFYTIQASYNNSVLSVSNVYVGSGITTIQDFWFDSPIPTVTTTPASSITGTSAQTGGNVTADGGATVTARGVCWSTSANPTISDNYTDDGSGTDSYTSLITGLLPGTIYYVRAYATNSVGTAYGNQISFTTNAVLPTLTTTAASSVTDTTAQSGGNVTADGGATVTARGVCWSTSQNPDTADTKTTDGTGTGEFTSSITGLSPGITYNVRAYATNSAGTEYGDQESFTTNANLPTLTTIEASLITGTTAQSGGNITDDGGATVTAKGVCWSKSRNPTISDNHTTDGFGTGFFPSSIIFLSKNNTYYVRAYATNSAGTAYGNEVDFSTPDLPTVTTAAISDITHNSATGGGEVTSDGGAIVTARGVCWSTSKNPTIAYSHTTDKSGKGTFISSITGLSPNTLYHVRAYAKNSVGTAYGDSITLFTGVTDYEGNIYEIVKIGNQIWMKENLKTTHYENGKAIPLVKGTSAWNALGPTDKAYCYYDNSSVNKDTYGALYTWAAAMNGASSSNANPSRVQGVCPTGWHLPSDAEWKELEMYLGMTPTQADAQRSRGTDQGTQLKQGGSSGFEALLGGLRGTNGPFSRIGYSGVWWSSTQTQSTYALHRVMFKNESDVYRSSRSNSFGFSVRCLRD